MNHVALNRAGPHDRDLNHEVIKGLWLHPGQHRHLRPALDLEDPDRVGLADHRVSRRVFGRDRREVEGFAFMLGEKVESPPHAPEHPEPEHVDLHEFQNVDVVLIPFDDLAVLHRCGLDRHEVIKAILREHEAAGMLRQMPRRADELPSEVERQLEPAVVKIEVQFLSMALGDTTLGPLPDAARKSGRHVFRKTESLADLSHGAASPIADHRCCERRPMPAIGL